MRYRVEVHCTVAADTVTVFRTLSAYDTLADGAGEVVKRVEVIRFDGNVGQSEWEVHFRRGLLCWTQRDRFDEKAGTIEFEAIGGDPLEFAGSWKVMAIPDGAAIDFSAVFDLGIGTLAEFLDPVAAETLATTVAEVLTGLFARASVERVLSHPLPGTGSIASDRSEEWPRDAS